MRKCLQLLFAAFIIISSSINVFSGSNENLVIHKNSWITIEENGNIRISTILRYPMNFRGFFSSDLIDSNFNITNINVGYGGRITQNDNDYLTVEHLHKVDNYIITDFDTPHGKFRGVKSYLDIKGTENTPGIVTFDFELNKSLNDIRVMSLNIENTIPVLQGNYNYIFENNLLTHKKMTYGKLRTLGELTLNESSQPGFPIYRMNGFNYTIDGEINDRIPDNFLIFNQIEIQEIKDYDIDVFENWIIEDKNETHYHIKINVNTKSNSSWPFYHPVVPGLNWIFNTLRKPENFIERPNNSARLILGINDTGADPMQGKYIKSCFSCNLSLQEMNDSDVLLDSFFIPDTFLSVKNIDINRTIYIEFDTPKSEFKKISTGVKSEYNWISTFYQKKILLLSNDYFFSSTPYTQEYLNEGYEFTKERNLIGDSTELFKNGSVIPLHLFSNRQNIAIESFNTSLDMFEIKTPETKAENYIENISISTFDESKKLIIASINTKETRSIHSINKNITIISYLYSVADPNDIKIKMAKPIKMDSFGSPYDYKSMLKDEKTDMEFNQLYVYKDNPNNQRDWYALFKIDRLNQNNVVFDSDYSSNLSSSLTILHSKIWEPQKWKLTYEKIFPPGEFPKFFATTVFNVPEGYQIVSVNENGQLIGQNTAKFISPLNENFTARKVMEINIISIAEKNSKDFLIYNFMLLFIIPLLVIVILSALYKLKSNFTIINKILPISEILLFLLAIPVNEFFLNKPASVSVSLTSIIVYLILLVFIIIILYILIQRYYKRRKYKRIIFS